MISHLSLDRVGLSLDKAGLNLGIAEEMSDMIEVISGRAVKPGSPGSWPAAAWPMPLPASLWEFSHSDP